MRVLKFRAWQKDMEMIIYPKSYYAENYNSGHMAEFYNPEENEFHVVHDFDDNFEIMQFTGLTDKNGKEVYEGDILEEFEYLEWCEECKTYTLKCKDFGCLSCEGDISWCEVVEGIEDGTWSVVGNIYESPELLDELNPKEGE